MENNGTHGIGIDVVAGVMSASVGRKIGLAEHSLLAMKVERGLLDRISEEGTPCVRIEPVEAYDNFGNAVGSFDHAEIDLSLGGGLKLFGNGDTLACRDFEFLGWSTLERLLESLEED